MRGLGPILWLSGALLWASLAGCASGGGTAAAPTLEEALPPQVAAHVVRAGDTPRIEAIYTNGPTTMTLRNARSISAQTAYSGSGSGSGSGVNLKVVEDEDVQRLLAAWTRLGFFEAAGPSAPGRAKATLTLRIDDRAWVRTRLPVTVAGASDTQQFADCASVFRFVYDKTRSYHTIKNVPATHFYDANRRLQQTNQEAILRSRGRK